MKDIRNKQLQNKLNKLGIKDVVLNFDGGYVSVWSEDDLTDTILHHADNTIQTRIFADYSVDEWAEMIKNIFDDGLESYERGKEWKNGDVIKIGSVKNLKESNDEKFTDYFSNNIFEKKIKEGLHIFKELPIELHKVEYNEKTKTLSVFASFYYKAYGKSYSYDEEYIGKRIPYGKEGRFEFDDDLKEDDVSMLVFLIQKDGIHYPTSYFHYNVTSKIQPMDFVDTIVLNYRKNFD